MQPHLELKIAIACYINFTDNSGNINNTYQNFTWTDICKFSALKNSGDTSFDIKTNVIRLDIIIVPISSFYTALLHFTGSAIFNQKMRLHAKSLNMKLSEYGLFKIMNNSKNPKAFHKYVAVDKELFSSWG